MGELKGRRLSSGPWSYLDSFKGIPFAAPPVGSLRFKEPQPAGGWAGTRAADGFFAPCDFIEDCLYLNVYKPTQIPPSDASLLPVMVWIYGGGYKTGNTAIYNAEELASKGNVVVVTISYRLGALGFLSTLDSASPGNYGLLDQILALKWVKDNIASFQGDPNDVTLFGQSAGAACVSLLRLSPLAQGLFNKAIMESGVSLGPWAVARPGKDIISPLQFAQSLGNETGCGAAVLQSNEALVSCLRNVTMDVILGASDNISNSTQAPIFRPTVETLLGVIPDDPLRLLTRDAGSNIPSIRGVNRNENSFLFLQTPVSLFTLATIKTVAFLFAEEYFPGQSQAVVDRIIAEYITSKNLTTSEQFRDAAIQVMTDFNFIVPAVLEQRESVQQSGHAVQYLYEFTYRATHTTIPAWAGVRHGSEVPFVFGQPFSHDISFLKLYPYHWTVEDLKMSMNMMTMWTNFAKYGNPTPQSVGGVSWVPYSLDSQSYLDIGPTLSVKANLAADRVQFWSAILNDVGAPILIG
ncbi:hypothetical protein V1264_023314 [Littorina saxatilis]